MNKALPDKWIRKAVYDAFNGTLVDGETIYIYDTKVTNDANADIPDHYVIQSTQNNEVDKGDKCEWNWESYLLLDITTKFSKHGNQGSRLLADNILEALKDALSDLTLDVASGLEILNIRMSFPSDLSATSNGKIIYRKFLRLQLYIK